MKVKLFGLFLPVILLLSVVISCGSTPETPPDETPTTVTPPPAPPPAPPPVDPNSARPDQTALNNLDAAAQRLEEARKMIEDFYGNQYFPEDWANAESLYERAQRERKTGTAGEVRDSIALYNDAAAAYEAMLEKTMARYAEDLENQIVAARNNALASGAAYLAPDYLLDIDNAAADALALYQAKDYYKARDAGTQVLDMYKILGVGVDAYKLRLEIEERDFYRYDPSNIAAADAIALSALDDYATRNLVALGAKANDLLTRYTRSLNIALQAYATDCGAAASLERQKALDLRANVAVRQEYDEANTIFIQGINAFQMRDFDHSAIFYLQARDLFITVTDSARERRRIAEETLREAERRMAESDELAQRAESIIEGGAR